jgi:hypothetical protein
VARAGGAMAIEAAIRPSELMRRLKSKLIAVLVYLAGVLFVIVGFVFVAIAAGVFRAVNDTVFAIGLAFLIGGVALIGVGIARVWARG